MSVVVASTTGRLKSVHQLLAATNGEMIMGRRSFALAFTVLFSRVFPSGHRAADDSDKEIIARINTYVRQTWKDNEIEPSPKAEDGIWARRVSLDVVGHIPSYDRLLNFLEDDSPNKRAKFVDALLADPDYVRNWTSIWGNRLVGRGEIAAGTGPRWIAGCGGR